MLPDSNHMGETTMTRGKKITLAVVLSRFALVSMFAAGALLFACSGSNDRITSYGLTAEDLIISHEKDGPAAEPRVFHPGDEIHIRFSLSDFQLDSEGNLWIQEDLTMNDPAGVSVLTRQNLIDDRMPPPEGMKKVPVNNTITLFDTAQPGNYTIQINVRDKVGGGAVYVEAEITVE
jgi:hypothetical protein